MTTALLVSQAAQWLVLGALAVTVLALAKQIGLLHKRLPPPPAKPLSQGPRMGALAPFFEGVDVLGRAISFPERGKRTLLVFIAPNCSTCDAVLPAIRAVARGERKRLRTVLVSLGSDIATRGYVERKGIELPVVASEALGEEFNVGATPYAFLIDEDRILRVGGLVNSIDHLESVLHATWDTGELTSLAVVAASSSHTGDGVSANKSV